MPRTGLAAYTDWIRLLYVYVTVSIDIQKMSIFSGKYRCYLTDLFVSIFSDHIRKFATIYWVMSILSDDLSVNIDICLVLCLASDSAPIPAQVVIRKSE